jgi:glycosyltransferase involved in cell wall biosynthesis
MIVLSILQVGFHVLDTDFAKWTVDDANPQNAARKLEGRYIAGYAQNGAMTTVLSFFPATNYPGNRKIFFGGRLANTATGRHWTAPFVNFLALKHVTRFLSSFVFMILWNIEERRKNRAIVIYSAHSPFLVASLLAKVLFRNRIYVIVPDLPSHMNFGQSRSWIWKLLKAIDVRFVGFLLSCTNGATIVAPGMAEGDLRWDHVPKVLIEGMVEVTHQVERNLCAGRKVFFYAGGLASEYGVAALLDAFEILRKKRINAELWICGRGALSDKIKELAERCDDIKYFGYIPQAEIDVLMKDVFCLVNCRNPLDEFVRYSFPSKLLEYLVSGVPILTTKLPGVPEEYDDFLNYIADGSAEMIATAIENMLSHPEEAYLRKAEAGRHFVLSSKNSQVQVSKLINLINRG